MFLADQQFTKHYYASHIKLMKLIYIQRTDSTFHTIDPHEPMSIISYFKKLLQSISLNSDKEIDRVIDNMMVQIVKKETKDDSIKIPGIEALLIMISTVVKIHVACQELGRDEDHSSLKTVDLVQHTLREALDRLSELCPP